MTESTWNGFRRIDFTFEGREAILVFPDENNAKNRWMLKTEYFNAFPDLEIELLKSGYHLAYVENINRWGLREDLEAKKRFCDYLIKTYGLAVKCVPVGMSCGGLFAIKFAGSYPEYVSVLYLDAPVVNILSLLGMGTPNKNQSIEEEEICEALSISRSELIAYRDHPLDYLPSLVKNKIPACLVYGNCDDVVFCHENARLIIDAYKNTDIPFMTFEKDGYNHHPHALEGLSDAQCEKLIEFIVNNDK